MVQALPWRRVDVNFKGVRMPVSSHNLIQVSDSQSALASYTNFQRRRLACATSQLSTHLQIAAPCNSCRPQCGLAVQVTRKWLDWEGEGVPRHIAQSFAAMEADPQFHGSSEHA